MNETITLPESIVCVGLFLVFLLVLAAGLIGYFKGVVDATAEEAKKEDL